MRLALGPVGVHPLLDHVDVVERVARPRRAEPRRAAHARERHRAHPEPAAVLRERPDAPLHVEVLAAVLDVLARPEAPDDRDRLLEELRLVLARAAEELELRLEVADADSEDHPPTGDHVDHRGVLGHLHRVVERQEHDRRAEVDALRHGGEGAEPDERGGHVAVVHHVVLGEEEPVEADLLGELPRLEDVLPAPGQVAGIRRVLGAEQQAELHLSSSSSGVAGRVRAGHDLPTDRSMQRRSTRCERLRAASTRRAGGR